jgi:hypothetical protein
MQVHVLLHIKRPLPRPLQGHLLDVAVRVSRENANCIVFLNTVLSIFRQSWQCKTVSEIKEKDITLLLKMKRKTFIYTLSCTTHVPTKVDN